MNSKKLLLVLPFLVLGIGLLMGMLVKYRIESDIIKLQHGDYDIELIRNSESLSQAVAINARGSVIGTREVSDDSGVTLSLKSFYCGMDECKDMPMPEGFTNVEAVAISDNDVVVGFASRTIGHEGGSLRAVVWKPQSGTIELLPPADGDEACHAQSITADGTMIAGYTTGPNRLRPAVWSRDEASQDWIVVVLDTLMDYNPYLMSSTLQISPDGTRIVGCCTERILPGDIIDSSLFGWREKQGQWERTLLNKEQMYIRDLNIHGAMVGSLLGPEGRLPCFVSPEGEIRLLGLLQGDVAGEARGINERSLIVGWSDQPHGPEGGPKACTWEADGTVAKLDLSEIPFGMVFGVNDSGQLAGMLTVADPGVKADSSQTATSQAGPAAELALAFRASPVSSPSKR